MAKVKEILIKKDSDSVIKVSRANCRVRLIDGGRERILWGSSR